MQSKTAKQLVVVGSGWAGFTILAKTKQLLKAGWELTVLSPRNYFCFTPLLASTCVGTLEYRAIVESVKASYPKIRFVEGKATNIEGHRILYRTTTNEEECKHLAFDRLILACGATTNTFGVAGVREHAHFLKDINDAKSIRRKIIDCFDKASVGDPRAMLHFVIVGGGPTGVEFAAELHDLLESDIARCYSGLMDFVQITLFDVAPRILGGFDAQLADYATRHFHRHNIQIRTGKAVVRIEENRLHLDDGEVVSFGMVVWVTGVGPTEFVQSLSFEKNKAGRLLVDDRLRLTDSIYALGDCAVIREMDLPCTAQVALQQARYLSKGTFSFL